MSRIVMIEFFPEYDGYIVFRSDATLEKLTPDKLTNEMREYMRTCTSRGAYIMQKVPYHDPTFRYDGETAMTIYLDTIREDEYVGHDGVQKMSLGETKSSTTSTEKRREQAGIRKARDSGEMFAYVVYNPYFGHITYMRTDGRKKEIEATDGVPSALVPYMHGCAENGLIMCHVSRGPADGDGSAVSSDSCDYLFSKGCIPAEFYDGEAPYKVEWEIANKAIVNLQMRKSGNY